MTRDVDNEYIKLLRSLLQSYHIETNKPAIDLLKKYIEQAGWPLVDISPKKTIPKEFRGE